MPPHRAEFGHGPGGISISIIEELKRRNVFKVAVAYVVIGWLILQVSEILVPALRLPDWVLTATLYFLVIGFFPAVIFAWAFELTPEGVKREKDVDRAASVTAQTGKKLNVVIIALLSVAVIYLGVDRFRPGTPVDEAAISAAEPSGATTADSRDESATPGDRAATTPPGDPSIAVLPFANISGEAENEYFADGVSEEILNALSRAQSFKVAGRTSSFAFKNRNENLRLIGETLNVTHILEGSVRKAGDTVRVTAQLIAVDDGFQLWSDTWDRQLDDIFAIQDEIAAAILSQLLVEFTDSSRIASTQTDPRAYEKYLTARQLMVNRSPVQLEEARVLLDDALELDERFAPAWAQRGILSVLLSEEQYGRIPAVDAQEQVRRFAEQALALDDTLAEGWAALGLYQLNRNTPADIALAIEYLERALALNPVLIDAANWLQFSFQQAGRVDDALALLEETVDRDPLYRPAFVNLNFTYLRRNQTDDMKALHDRLRPFMADQSRFWIMEAMYLNAIGDFSAALPLSHAAYAAVPGENYHANALARTLTWLNDWEGVSELDLNDAEFMSPALDMLGRHEEASIAAVTWFRTTGRSYGLLHHLIKNEKYEELMTLVDEQWQGVRGFHESNLPIPGFGHRDMLFVAEASRRTGREAAFAEAMGLIREEHDRQRAQGIDWFPFHYYEATYWIMANDSARAVDHIEEAVSRRGLFMARFSNFIPMLQSLEGDPRYDAAQAQARAHISRERVEAGYAPLEP